MRASSPQPTAHRDEARRDEAVALDELLERVEQLGNAYGPELLSEVEPWIERARQVATTNAPAREFRQVRDAIEETLFLAACARADDLMAEHGPRIDSLIAHAGLLGATPNELAAIIVDARSPDVPGELCSRTWPISIERRDTLARELENTAPNTAAALRSPASARDHDVVVVTLGRVMRTTRSVSGGSA
jgi:hypothetical protein